MNRFFRLNISVFLIIIFLQVVISCSNIEQNETSLSETVSPGSCRIVGTIISIEDFQDSDGPCSIQPCLATVQIDYVLKRGMGFTSTISKKSVIQLKFEYTLQPTTKEIFPKLNNAFPGLQLGDKFSGDIEEIAMIKIEATKTTNIYRIYNYDKVN